MRFLIRSTAPYAAALLACCAMLTLLTELWRTDLSVPLIYRRDALMGQVWAKAIVDHGWYLKNPQLGAPLRQEMHDFPMADNLHFAMIKLLACFVAKWPVVFNLYYLLGFPLTALTSLFALRQLGIKGAPAFVISQLYAFLPYHWNRGETHLFLSAYYVVPLSILVAIWLCLGRLGGVPANISVEPALDGMTSPRRRLGFSALVCALQASAGIYYAFFASFLFVVAGAAACVRARNLRLCLPAVGLLAITMLGILANIAPSLVYWSRRGTNPEVAQRMPVETEISALKLAPLLLPAEYHNCSPLAALRLRYNTSSIYLNESASATLGTTGAVGFLAMLGWILFVRCGNARRTMIDALAMMNLALVLLATTGGFGMIFSVLVHPQIRSYNRASVFIAFLALTTVAMGLDWFDRRCATARSRTIFGVSMILLLVAGILDQSSFDMLPMPSWEGPYRKQFHTDAEFVARMEAALPAGAAVYQLPYTQYPEGFDVHLMEPYDHFRPYLHSRSLRFSHGAMHGREADRWQRAIQALPVDEFLAAIVKAGFVALYIDRRGYADGGKHLEQELRCHLQREPIENASGEICCFVLYPMDEKLASIDP